MPLAAFMPVAQEFEHVTVAFAGVDAATAEVFRDCFKDFRIAVQTREVDARSAAGTSMDACVLRLDAPGAEDLLRAIRQSEAHRRCLVLGIGSQEDALRMAEFGINALIERLTAREISSAIRNCYLLLVHRLRRFVRIPIVLPLTVTSEDKTVQGITRDISAGGLNIASAGGIGMGRKVQMDFTLPGDFKLSLDGVICWETPTAFGVALFNSSRQARLRTWTEQYLHPEEK